MNNPHGQTVLGNAQTYVARGWKVVPTPERTKDPVLLDWPNLDLTLEDLPTHFAVNGHRPNIGVILGRRSRGIVDVDNDTPEAIAFAKLWLPATDALFGRKSKRRSHYLYYAADGVGPKTTQFKRPGNPREKTGTAMIVELRSNVGQTIFPGSIHESGEPVEWERDGEPATIDVAALERAVHWIAAGSLLVPFWGEGRRNYLALALAGALLRAEWTVEDAASFIEGVAQVAGDPEWSKRRRQCVEPTAAKLTDGANVVGVPALADQIGDQAVVKALVSWLRLGRPTVPHKVADDGADTADASPAPGMPEIDAGIQSLQVVTGAAWDALKAANAPPRYFRQTGLLVRLHRDDTGGLTVQGLDDTKLRHEMARVAHWWEWKKRDGGFAQVDAKPPLDVMRDMLATPEPPVPVLTRIVQAPIFAADGTLLVTPGYHPSARVYYDPPIGLTLPEIPEHPTAPQRDQARRLIVDEMLGDFPFIGLAERAHAVALFLLPFVRELIAGGTPLHLIEAPTPGSGKGLLAELLLVPSLGSSPYVMAAATDDEEWRKRITSALLKAPGALQIDNVTRPLASGVLAAALTMPEWTDRPLGSTDIVRAPVRVVWLCTANNVVVSTEIARRCARIRLDPQVDRPWERQAAAFKKPRLAEWVANQRGELVAAALTLVRAWIDEGRPHGSKTLGRFEQWSEVMGGILGVAGIPGFLTNLHEFYDASDAEGAVLHRFVSAWWEAFQDQEVASSDLFPIAQEIDGLDLGRGADHSQKIIFGKHLGRMRDRVIGNYRVVQGRIVHKTVTWRLLPTKHTATPDSTTPPAAGGVGGVGGCFVPLPTHEKDNNDTRTRDTHVQGRTKHPPTPPTPPLHSDAIELRAGAVTRNEGEKVTEVKPEEVVGGAGKESLRPCPGCGTPTLHGWTCRGCRLGQPPTTAVMESADRPVESADAPSAVPALSHTAPTATVPVSAPAAVVRDEGPAAPYTMLTTAHDVEDMLTSVRAAPVVGLDTETTGLAALTDRLRLVQIATPDAVYMLDAFALDPRLIAPLLQGDGPLVVGHNLKFDLRFLDSAGIPIPTGHRLFDTMLASQLLSAGAGPAVKHGLAAVAERALGLTLSKDEQKSDWSGALRQEQLAYAAKDAAILPRLADRLRDDVASAGLQRVCDLEMRALPTIAWVEQCGLPFDVDAWTRLADPATAERALAHQELTDIMGSGGLFAGTSSINWSSSTQVKALLRERGHDIDSADEHALHALALAGEPLAAPLLRHRDASKRATTYGRDYLKWIHPQTGRIHPSFVQLGSDAGRMSCREPNAQQFPRGAGYRACIRPAEGRVLVKADYAQIELRLAAEIAGDRRMIEAFNRGEDLHTLTARAIRGTAEVTKADRQAAKATNFGLLYGQGAEGLRVMASESYGVTMSLEEAETARRVFFQAYPELRAWQKRVPNGAQDTRTLAGRRRSGITSYTRKLNSPVQGSGADGLKAALGLLGETRDRVSSAAPINVVHDEIVVECDRDQAEEARAWVMDAMRSGMETVLHRVPAEVEATICGDWSGIALDGGAP